MLPRSEQSWRARNVRLDRFFTLTVMRPARRFAGSRQNPALPILMYHRISDDEEAGIGAYYKVNVSRARFAEQMSWLARNGFRTLDLVAACEQIRHGEPFSQRQVVLTFDDGFRDFYLQAFPVLNAHGFTATNFLPTSFIGDARKRFKGNECLTWQEVEELRDCGLSFGSHTVTHPELVHLPWDKIGWELTTSKKELEHRLGKPVHTFAYPFAFPQGDGSFARDFKHALEAGGYTCCVTTEIGRVRAGEDVFRLKRLPINSLDDMALFQAKLEGAYDWLGAPQALVKGFKARVRSRTRPRKAQVGPVGVSR
jgi:peptidoglycan/xylan/chitin deacetylase (PgdA/CDA1 family)